MTSIPRPLPLALAVFLSACTSAPPAVTVETVPHIQAAVLDVADVTYLAKDMLPGRHRGAATIYGSLPSPDASGVSPATGLGGGAIAAAAGQSPVSSGGVGTAVYASASLALAGALLDGSDKPHDWISGVYLPQEVNGQVLATAEQARQFIRGEALRGLDAFAKQTGRTVVCADQCEGFYPTYELRKSGEPSFAYFDPPTLYVSLYIRPLKTARSYETVRDKAVGFKVAWETAPSTNSFVVCLNEHPPAVQNTVTEQGETFKIYSCTSPQVHPLERVLYRNLTAAGHTYAGVFGHGFFAWHGRVFALGERAPKTLIKYEIAPETDNRRDR